ncbi:LPXTG cell wall anchor domain-containing protein [Streptomyces sp. NPDC093097]|uniref:LPXTG cell wall anchor domain-containing protein n=1 Tax=Streptomyces sp. NPDC093097 TaxID=3366027 RepID=UPI003813D84E
MKFRQVLTAAAAATVIAPAAVLATPAAALATETPGPSAHANEPQRTRSSDKGGESPGAQRPTTAADGAAEPGTGSGDKPAPEATPDKESAPEAKPDKGPAPEAKPDQASGSNSVESSGGSSDDSPPGPHCESAPTYLQMAIKGLPSGFVVGADWSQASITVTNTSDKAMERVRPQPYIASSEIVDRQYDELEAEFRNPVTGKWLTFEDATIDSEFTGFPVAAHSTVTLPLRVRAIVSAKPGAGYAIIEGTFYNKDGSCGDSNHEQYDFKILPAGGKPGKPGRPGKPSESANPGGGATGGSTGGSTPQGGAEETAANGQLAATGSSSALPTIALVGGVAMAVGAGAVITVRRRKATAGGGSGAAA